MEGVSLGKWSTILLLGSLHGLIVAGLLLRTGSNRLANRCLAALLLVVVLRITPYTIGYAGFYDAFPWLTFAPFFWELALGPLIWLYVRQLGRTALPRGWAWHFLPALMQGGYYLVVFPLPLELKWAWNEAGHQPWVAPLESLAMYVSLAVYWGLALRDYRRYQAWLEQNSGAREELRLPWLRGFLAAIAMVVLVMAGFGAVHRFVVPLSYFDEFPLYLCLVALVWYLGVEGWRHAAARYPTMPSPQAPDAPDAPVEAVGPAPGVERDWRALGQAHAAKLAAAGWWREPDLSLADLARRLGTNTHYLSRAFNEGLGMSFNDVINRQRVEAARGRLAGEGEILAIALEVGFGSKASFNRAFRTHAGCTPSQYRRQCRDRA